MRNRSASDRKGVRRTSGRAKHIAMRSAFLSCSLAALVVLSACADAPVANDADDAEELAPDVGEGDVAGATLDVGAIASAKDDDTITAGDLAIVVPAVGEGVATIAELDDGSWQSFGVERGSDGVVRVVDVSGEAASAGGRAGSPAACKDRAFATSGFRWKTTYEWSFRVGSTPETNSRSAVEQRLKEAAANVSSSRNDCGLADKVTATQKYLGKTTRSTNVVGKTTGYSCGKRDGHNVVGFGVLPKGILGVACTWFSGDGAVESDVKINDRGYRWFAGNTPPKGCSNRFSVEGVATHEMGHVFGLAHVSEAAHGNLTMSTRARPCTASDTTLGLGDVLGLRKKYGP